MISKARRVVEIFFVIFASGQGDLGRLTYQASNEFGELNSDNGTDQSTRYLIQVCFA